MHAFDPIDRQPRPGNLASLGLAAAATVCLFGAPSVYGQVPGVVFSQTSGVTGVGSSAGVIDYGGTVAHIAANSRGDVFGNVATGGAGYVLEQPVDGGAQVALITGLGGTYGGHSIYVDSGNNVWVADTGDAQVLYIPFVNGSYPANIAHGSLSNCAAFPVPASQATSCIVPLGYPPNLGYYVQTGDLGLDGAGNLYLLDKYTGGGDYPGVDVLIQVSAATGQFTLLSTTLQNDASAQIAVSSEGDVFEVGYGSVHYFPAGNYANPTGVPNMNNPNGVSMDASGNLFITNNGANDIIEIPHLSGAYDVNTQYIVSNQLGSPYTGDASQGVAIDGSGRITYAGNYPNSLSALTVGQIAFGGTAFGTTSGAQSANVVFNAAVTLGPVAVAGPAGAFAISANTCTKGSAFAVGANCSVSVTYTATAVGPQSGQLTAYDNAGNLLGTAVLSGFGQAPLLNVDPGAVNAIASATGSKAPSAIAVDSAGNAYVADSSTGSVYESLGGTAALLPIATGLHAPSAIAVDGAGNLYIGEAGEKQIVELPYSGGVYGSPMVLASGLKGPSGLALDEQGNLYVADSGNARVLRLSRSGGMGLGSLVEPFGSGFTTPVAVAVDNNGGNVYVSDAGAKQVVQVSLATSAQTTVLSGLTTPAGVAVDASGSLYSVDSGTQNIVRLPDLAGDLNKNFELTLAPIVAAPAAIAIDNAGNVYAADTTANTVGVMLRTTGAINFGKVNVQSSSSTVAATVSDGGSQPLIFNTPYFTAAGDTTDFAIDSSSTCAPGATVDPGAACSVASIFSPLTAGPLTDTLTFSSNSAAAGSLALSGSGAQLAPTSVALAVTAPTGTISFGQPVTISATVTAQTAGGPMLTGTVTFYLDTVAQKPVALNGAKASITFSGLTGGTHSITASYSGDGNYAYSASPALTLTIATATTTTAVSVSAPYSNPTAANPPSTTNPQSITFTAIVAPALPGTPTGTVTFYNGAMALGVGTVLPVVLNGNAAGQAVFVATTLPVGQYNISAVYSGDANYSGSTSATSVPLLVSNPTISMTSKTTSISGGGGSIFLNFTSVAGFGVGQNTPSAVDLSCTGLPQYAVCSFQPAFAVVTPSVPAQVAFSVLIDQPPVIVVPSSLGGLPAGNARGKWAASILLLSSVLLGLALWRANNRRKGGFFASRTSAILAFLLLAGSLAALNGCANTSSISYITPKGTSTVTVNATISSTPVAPNPPVVESLKFQLTVN